MFSSMFDLGCENEATIFLNLSGWLSSGLTNTNTGFSSDPARPCRKLKSEGVLTRWTQVCNENLNV